jgi:uncharacterized protein YdgA (DUF945 family)
MTMSDDTAATLGRLQRWLKVALGVVAGVVVLHLVAAWFIGGILQARIDRQLDQLAAQVPFVVVADRSFARGWLASDYYFTLRFIPGTEEDAGLRTAATTPAAYDIKLKNVIRHGPLPGFTALGLARIDAELVGDAKTSAEWRERFGGRIPLDLRTWLDFTGGGRTRLRSQPFTNVAFDGAQFSAEGAEFVLRFDRAVSTLRADGELKRLVALTDNGDTSALHGLALVANLERIRGAVYAGDVSASIESVAVDRGHDSRDSATERAATVRQKLRIEQLPYSSRSTASGDYLSMVLRAGAERVEVAESKLGRVHYDITLKRLQVPTLDRLYTAMRNVTDAAQPRSEIEASANARRTASELRNLLVHDPELVFDRVSLAYPEGEARITGYVCITGGKDLEPQFGLFTLLPKIEAGINGSLDEAVLGRVTVADQDQSVRAHTNLQIDSAVERG